MLVVELIYVKWFVHGSWFLHAFGNDFTGYSTDFVEPRIPKLEIGLPLAPFLADEKRVHDTRFVLVAACGSCGVYDCICDYWAVCSCDEFLLELYWDDVFDLIF